MSIRYIPKVYLLRTLTNLHMGGGDSNYDHVDKQVQRDAATGYPTIFSSGIKGALRDFMIADGVIGEKVIQKIFGSKPEDNDSKQGDYRFLSGDLLALPQPADNKPFELITTDSILTAFQEKVTLMGGNTIDLSKLADINRNEQAFKILTEELPVIARNHLENGISQNLWYEEVVPREAFFGFTLLVPEQDTSYIVFGPRFENKVIQIGANATIGYGLCHVTKISEDEKN